MKENINPKTPATPEAICAMAATHQLYLQPDSFKYNETGLDFQVIHAKDTNNKDWILRVPRRQDVLPRARNEQKVLTLLKDMQAFSVPDWQIFEPELIAYLQLEGTPVANIDMEQKCYIWNLNHEHLPETFISSLGKAIAALHATNTANAQQIGLKISEPKQVRENLSLQMQRIKQEMGVAEELWQQWQTWLHDDSYWPSLSSLVHGDLQAAHILTDNAGTVNGLLDWTEAEVSDPAIDFVALLAAFGEQTTKAVLEAYEQAGGKVWPRMLEHIQQRHASYGVNIGLFVLESGTDEYLPMAKEALGMSN